MCAVRAAEISRDAAERDDRAAPGPTCPARVVVPLGQEFEPLERRIGYRFRDRGLLEHALTHKSRAHEDASGGVVDNESLEFLGDAVLGFVVADLLFREFPQLRRGAEVEDEGVARLDDGARAAGRADRPRRAPAARPRRGEDRRPPQAGAARRRLRGADRRDLSRRRHRAGARVHRAASSRDAIAARARRTERRCAGLQVGAAGAAAGRDDAAARVPAGGDEPGPDHRKRFQVEVRVAGRRAGRGRRSSKKEAEQEAARRGARAAA